MKSLPIFNIDLISADAELKHFGSKVQKIQNCSIVIAKIDETKTDNSERLKMMADQIKRGFIVALSQRNGKFKVQQLKLLL